jgi:hypothetical protein
MNVGVKFSGFVLAAACATALVPAASGGPRPQTTEPTDIVDFHVRLTDTRMIVDKRVAERDIVARFLVRNTGKRIHNFEFDGRFRTGPIRPKKTALLLLFFDYRGTFTMRSSVPRDQNKPGFRLTFRIN